MSKILKKFAAIIGVIAIMGASLVGLSEKQQLMMRMVWNYKL